MQFCLGKKHKANTEVWAVLLIILPNMSLSYLLMLLNPLLMVAGVAYIIFKARPALPAGSNQQSPDSSDSDDEDPGGGDDNWDWDAPLDLPPGVCLMPSGPEPVHA